MTTAPCPVCATPGGFHVAAGHAYARARIPAHLRHASHARLRAELRERAAAGTPLAVHVHRV